MELGVFSVASGVGVAVRVGGGLGRGLDTDDGAGGVGMHIGANGAFAVDLDGWLLAPLLDEAEGGLDAGDGTRELE